jgi:hypothetical protein
MASRKLTVEILGDSRSLERAFSRGSKAGQRFNIGIGTIVKSALVFGAVERGIDAVAGAIRSGVSEWSQQVTVGAQTNAVLKSTQGIANVTRKQVDKLATSIARYSGRDDEAVKSSENLLLTFKNVRNELGKGNKVFDRAAKAAVDLSQAGFGDLSATSKQLGKALNDPVKGMTALGRAGVTFTKSQRDTIKALVESGKLLQAQKLILREVESQVGGSAKAFGQTLPGQLARLRESFRNVFGDLVGQVTPALTGALDAVNRFVDDLGKARTVRAKIRLVFDRVTGAAESIADRIGDAVAAIDWEVVWSRAQGIADGLQKRLEEIDFGFVGKRIGDGIAGAVRVAIPAAKELGERITKAIRAIDFEALGRELGPALAAAVVTGFLTLADPAFWIRNWDLALAVALTAAGGPIGRLAGRFAGLLVSGLARALVRISPRLGNAFRGLALQAVRFFGVGLQQIGRVLAPFTNTVSKVFARLGRITRFVVKVVGITAAINAIIDFSKKVGDLFAGLAVAIINAFGDVLIKGMKIIALKSALAIVEPFSHLPDRFGSWARDLKDKWNAQLQQMEINSRRVAASIQRSIDGIEGKTVTVTIETRLRTIGDAGERGARAGTIPTAAAKQAKAVQDTAGAITRDAAKAEGAASKGAKAGEKMRKAFERLIESLTLKLDRAQVTKGFRDDLRVLTQMETAVRERIRVEGKTLDLERQLFEIQQQRADIRRQQREALTAQRQGRQFRALGLTATGAERVPGVGALRKRLATLRDQVKGTFLDTAKTRTQLDRIAKVLSGQFGKVGRDVRAAILQMFADISGALSGGEGGGPLTKAKKLNINTLLAGLGLSEDEIRALRSRLSQLTSATPVTGAGGGGRVGVPAGAASFGGGLGAALIINGGLHLHGVQNVNQLEAELQKRARRRGGSRGGVRPGGRSGLS